MFSGGIQIAYVLYLKRKGRVADYDVPERLQRTGPYLISAALSAVGLAILYLLRSPDWTLALMWCYASNTLILALINRFWKISAHMMGLTGPLTALVVPTGFWMLAGMPLAVLLGWARVRLRAHTLAQVIAGAAAGVVLTTAQLFAWFSYVQALLPPV